MRILKPSLLLLISVLLFSCSRKSNPQGEILTGKINVGQLANSNKYGWFKEGYQAYKPDSATIEYILQRNRSISVDIFMGTWCEDTQRELPRFIKVLDLADVPSQGLTLYALDRNKQGVGDVTAQNRIEYVPTFIIYYKGREVGRIVEHPKKSLEADVMDMLKKSNF